MSAPATTARQTPAHRYLQDGYPIQIAFSGAPTISLWEKMLKPPGIDGGEPIDNTTMHNKTWKTLRARKLKSLTPHTFKFAYNPQDLATIVAQVNVEQAMTTHFPDYSTWDYYAFLQKVEFDDVEEGKQPEGTATIVPTNWDPTNNVEAGPVWTAASGTSGMSFP